MGPVLAFGFVLIALLGVGLAAIAGRGRPPRWDGGSDLAAVARATARWRVAGLLTGVAAAALVARADPLGRGLLLATPLIGLGVMAGVLAGELRVPRPSGVTRTAGLEVRRARDYLPRTLAPLVGVTTCALLGLVAVTTLTAAPDDLGRAGRSVQMTCRVLTGTGTEQTLASAGPWPGSFYSLPLAAAVLGGLLVAGAAVLRVTRRPRQSGNRELDDALRRNAVAAVVAAVGVLVGVPLAGVGAVSSVALRSLPCLPAAGRVLPVALGLVVLAALLITGWCAAVLARPVRPPAVHATPSGAETSR